jgi:hypothetical protein
VTGSGGVPEIQVHRSTIEGLKLFDVDRLRWLDEAAALGPLVALRLGPVRVWVGAPGHTRVTDAVANV